MEAKSESIKIGDISVSDRLSEVFHDRDIRESAQASVDEFGEMTFEEKQQYAVTKKILTTFGQFLQEENNANP